MTIGFSPAAATRVFASRDTLSLDGSWDFRLNGHDDWRKASVPNPWQAEFADLREATGVASYARSFALPAGWQGRQVAVCFGAASYFAEVSVNGRRLGSHEGGYLPFEFVVPAEVLGAENRIEVTVTLPSGDDRLFPEFPFAEIPHGKQSWYGPIGGLWQSVRLEARDERHISACRIRANRADGGVAVEADLSAADCGGRIAIEIADPDGRIVATGEAQPSGSGAALRLAVPEVRPWSPDRPDLYRATLRLTVGDEAIDTRVETFGFRSFESRGGRFLLNGEPFYMRGALDQDYYPDGIATPPSTEFLENQVRQAKALGLNTLRVHIKIPDPRYYEVADRLGMLVWTEIPNVETFSEAAARRMRDTMEGILARDGNHPSIVAWTIINEDWGTRLREAADQRGWLAAFFDWLKSADPTRLVVDNSPCAPNYHIKTDINDFHYYRTVPERRGEWDQLTAEFAAGADWTFSPHGDAVRAGDEPLVVSEFGVWGLPETAPLRSLDGTDPWWFASGDLWSDGAASPQGVEERFRAMRLDTVFGSFERFAEATQWYQFATLKYEIESLRSYASIAGYVVTELTDVHWEANGLMDMARNPRVFGERFAEVNADIAILPGLDRWAYWSGEALRIAPRIASGGRIVPAGSMLEWRIGTAGGRIDAPPVPPLSVEAAAALEIELPKVEAAATADLEFRLVGPAGEPLAVNTTPLALHPRRAGERRITVGSDEAALRERFAGLGYGAGGEDADVFVTRRLDASRIAAINAGQRVLLLAESANAFQSLRTDAPPREQPHQLIVDTTPGIPSQPYFAFPGYGLHNRDNTVWRGDWVTNFSWLKRDGAFAALPGGPLLDLTFDRVVPRAVITGFRPWEFDGRIHAAVAVGWLHKPAATVIEKALGRGKLVATTFRLCEDAPGADPTATALADGLLRLAAQVQSRPPASAG